MGGDHLSGQRIAALLLRATKLALAPDRVCHERDSRRAERGGPPNFSPFMGVVSD